MGALSPNAETVNGTGGLNAGTAKQMGWNPQQIQQSGTTPNVWQNLVKGGATGLAQGLQSYGSGQGNVGGIGGIDLNRPRSQNPYFYGYGR